MPRQAEAGRSAPPRRACGAPKPRCGSPQGGQGCGRLLFGVLALLLGLLMRPGIAAARVQAREADVKAAFLYNFTKYIEWPAGAFADASDAFRVCVLADEEFTRTVGNFVNGETVQGRPIHLIVPRMPDVPRCHVLFVGENVAARERAVLAAAANRPVLTVGETAEFLDRGGIVRFDVETQRVRFDIHLQAATRAGLIVSSKLVRVARHVRESSLR